MSRIVLKNSFSRKNNTNSSILKGEDLLKLTRAQEVIISIKEKYNFSDEDLNRFIEEEIFFPISIINKKLTVLESVVKYLKEEKGLSLNKISKVVNRDERNVWHIYHEAKKKFPQKFAAEKTSIKIPISVIANIKLSALENIVCYIKENLDFSYHNIALLIKRNDRTVWTVYNRAKNKRLNE